MNVRHLHLVERHRHAVEDEARDELREHLRVPQPLSPRDHLEGVQWPDEDDLQFELEDLIALIALAFSAVLFIAALAVGVNL
jgi:hypothetical protein